MSKRMKMGAMGILWMCGLALLASVESGAADNSKLKDFAAEINIPDVVARVNGKNISSQYIKFKYNRIMDSLSKQPNANIEQFERAQKVRIAQDVIDKEITRELMRQTAATEKKTADPQEVAQAFDALKASYANEKDFLSDIKSRNLTVESLKENIAIDVLIRELVNGQIRGKIHISDDDVKKFYDQNKPRFQRPEGYRVRHILIRPYSEEEIKKSSSAELEKLSRQAGEKARKVLAEIRGGAKFTDMVAKYSQDAASAAKQGDLDWIYKGVFDSAFDEAVIKLQPQQISDVVQTGFGYHIIQLLETRPPDTAPFEEMKESIQRMLFLEEGKKELQKYVEQIRKDAKVELLF